jgi:prolyl oligopeptidase
LRANPDLGWNTGMPDLPILSEVKTPRIPVSTVYHGVEVIEEYRWLEEPDVEETAVWTEAQAQRTREYLDAIPCRSKVRARAAEVLGAGSTSYTGLCGAGSTFFAVKHQPPQQQPFLVALDDLDDTGTERLVVDPNQIDPSGETTMDFFVPSPDGTLVAVSLSEHGTEDGALHVFDTVTGAAVSEPIPHVNLMGGSVAWRGDGRAFWYTRPADPDGFHQQVWFRDLDVGIDQAELTGGFADDKVVEHVLASSPDGHWVMDRAQRGDGGEWQILLRRQDAPGDPAEAWWQVADIADQCVLAVFGDDVLHLLSMAGAPRGKVLRLPLSAEARGTVASAEEVVPESEVTICDLAATTASLWVVDVDGGPCRVRAFGLDGTPLPPVDVPPVSSIGQGFALSSELPRLGRHRVAWSGESFTEPAAWWVADDGAAPRRTALGTTTSVDLSGFSVTRELATSQDGTRVPISIVAAPGTPRDGSAPALLTAYGGYGINLVPRFSPENLLWLEQGGVYAVANIRGGGEYGDEWHRAGSLAAKQNCFDDFIACADHLVETLITSRDKLAIMGGSNGGLLMGAVITQRRDLANAVIAAVPVMDSLRSETTTNGVFNVAEYGSVADPDMFTALLAYSPYHNVEDGVSYPAVLLTAGEFDPRVDAWHAKKMTARLQAATASKAPILLRMESGGHGLGQSRDQRVELAADYYTFLFTALDVPYR